jgi:hypothetical protein
VTTININLLGIEQKERFLMGGGSSVDQGWMMAIGCIVGVIGSLWAVSRYLDV